MRSIRKGMNFAAGTVRKRTDSAAGTVREDFCSGSCKKTGGFGMLQSLSCSISDMHGGICCDDR
jgi:hypothetical protein